MNQEEISLLEARLARAESQLERLHRQARFGRWCLLGALGGGALFLLSRPAATQMEAETLARGATRVRAPFVVVDSRGRKLLQVSDAGVGTGLVLFDRKGEIVAGLGTGTVAGFGGRGFLVMDGNGKPIFLGGEGSVPGAAGRGVSVFDPQGRLVGALATGTRNNNPLRGLAVVDEAGVVSTALGTGRYQGTEGRGVAVMDSSGAVVSSLRVDDTGDRGKVSITERDGTALFEEP